VLTEKRCRTELASERHAATPHAHLAPGNA